MALRFYDSSQVAYSNISGSQYGPLDTDFDGRLGGANEILVYIRNTDPATYYTDVQVSLIESDAADSVGILG